jgi:hypothetical protein
MANLVILRNGKESKNLNEEKVHPEEIIEKMIFENKTVLQDIVLLKRQLPSYTKEERIDLVGLDNENNIVVIEIKKDTVDETTITQVMRYAMWVETHPDAVKSIWLEQRDLHEDFDFDWNKPSGIRMMIIGPSFKSVVPRLANRINYPLDLIEFRKFSEGNIDYIFLNSIEIEEEGMARPIDTTREYDLEYYKKNRNPKSAEQFWKLAGNIELYVKQKGWNLRRSNTQYYISFKSGFPIVFGITWIGSKSFNLFFKIQKTTYENKVVKEFPQHKYDERWSQALYKVESSDIDLTLFDDLFEAAYKNIVG